MSDQVTRGRGILENFLARKRAEVAERLIPEGARSGRLLDLGSGSFPYFLVNTDFAERYGIDKTVPEPLTRISGVTVLCHDFEHDSNLPFEDDFFDVVTMLAVFEHLPPEILHPLLADVRRVLRPGGRFIMTTPAVWADPILRVLAWGGLVSAIEIDEHQGLYNHRIIRQHLERAGFDGDGVRCGYFELFLNLWATARL